MCVIQAYSFLHFTLSTPGAASQRTPRVTRQRRCRGNPGTSEGAGQYPGAAFPGLELDWRVGERECQALARAAWGWGSLAGVFDVAPKDALDLPGAGAQSASMAAQREGTTPPLRVLEEALGLGSTAAGDVEDAVAAEGTYYLERILPVWARPPVSATVTGVSGEGRGFPLRGRLLRLGTAERPRHLLHRRVASLPPQPPSFRPTVRWLGCRVAVGSEVISPSGVSCLVNNQYTLDKSFV